MENKLANSEILKLISLYRAHDLLWDMSSTRYRRNDLKIKAHGNIASEMGLPVEIIKKKIRALRNTYTNEKRKVLASKRSGCGADDLYEPQIFWFQEMSFLDSSIISRKTLDSSNENSSTSQSFEDLTDNNEFECFSNENCKRASEDESYKFDKALEKLIKINEDENDEFRCFGASMAQQLKALPREDAYVLMSDMQNLMTQKKMQNLRKRKFAEISSSESLDSVEFCLPSTSRPRTSTQGSSSFSDILSTAISDAEIDFNEQL